MEEVEERGGQMYGGGGVMVLEVGEEEMNTDAEEGGVVEAERRDPQE